METDNTRIMNGENDTAAKRAMGLLMTVSHEVREPLNAITELTELALSGSLPASTRGQLRRIGEATRYISDIMSDLLDLSMFETGRLALSPKEFQLDPLIRETADLFSVRCKAAGVSFTCRVSPKVREAYVGDAGRIRQIVTNLLGSALSHTSRGGEIILDVRQTREGHHSADLTFAVIDNGEGYEPEALQHLTDVYQTDENADVEHTLGLTITSDLVQLMGGTMTVDSKVHVGTRITVEISLALPDGQTGGPKENEEPSAIDIDFQGRRILLVEDNQINAEVTADMLAAHGFRVEHAVNGEEAVTLFESAGSGFYDAILMDIRMPRMNGLDAVRRIRASKHADAKDIPIIAMSANAFAEDIEKSLAAGMNAHLSKPVDQETLFRCLAEYLL